MKGQRPPGIADKRFESAYIFAAVRPLTGEDFALVLPWVSAAAMSTFLADFAETVPADTHVVMVLDQAGWHGAKDLVVPECLTLVLLPSYSPDLTRLSGSGSTCASAISPIVCWTTTRLSWMPAAKPEMPSPPRKTASDPSPATLT